MNDVGKSPLRRFDKAINLAAVAASICMIPLFISRGKPEAATWACVAALWSFSCFIAKLSADHWQNTSETWKEIAIRYQDEIYSRKETNQIR